MSSLVQPPDYYTIGLTGSVEDFRAALLVLEQEYIALIEELKAPHTSPFEEETRVNRYHANRLASRWLFAGVEQAFIEQRPEAMQVLLFDIPNMKAAKSVWPDNDLSYYSPIDRAQNNFRLGRIIVKYGASLNIGELLTRGKTEDGKQKILDKCLRQVLVYDKPLGSGTSYKEIGTKVAAAAKSLLQAGANPNGSEGEVLYAAANCSLHVRDQLVEIVHNAGGNFDLAIVYASKKGSLSNTSRLRDYQRKLTENEQSIEQEIERLKKELLKAEERKTALNRGRSGPPRDIAR